MNTIPPFAEFLRPTLAIMADGKSRTLKDVRNELIAHFKFTPKQLEQRTKGGTKTIVYDRSYWAVRYLKRAGLLKENTDDTCKITQVGHDCLKENPELITPKILLKYKSFQEFKGFSFGETVSDETPDTPDTPNMTPDDTIAEMYNQIHESLIEDILSKILSCSPTFFEQLVLDLLVKMGYGEGKVTKQSHDNGIDVIINEDALGLKKILIQAKRYAPDNKVQAPAIDSFIGALDTAGVHSGIFITTTSFTDGALKKKSTTKQLIKVDGKQLAELMIKYNVGVGTKRIYEIKSIDTDYFQES